MSPYKSRSLYAILNGWIFRFGAKRVVGGVTIATLGIPRRYAQLSLGRLEEALQLIARYDPTRFRRIRRDAPRVVVGVPGVGDACFQVDAGFVVISLEVALREDMTAPQLARLLVHEAAHARIELAGIGYSEALRIRIEQACERAELGFCDRLPEPDRSWHTREVRERLNTPQVDLSDDALVEWRMRELQRAGYPAWFINWIRRAQLRRLDRERSRS